MMCEMCGKDMPYLKSVVVEAAVLQLCPECSRFGKEVSQRPAPPVGTSPVVADRLERRARRSQSKDVFCEIPKEELVVDYPQRITRARNARGWDHKELGKKINEKVSIISKLETGEFRPDDALVKKLEQALEIKLKGPVEDISVRRGSKGGPLTLADLVKSSKR